MSFTGIFDFFLNDERGDEAHGINNCIRVASKKAIVKEMWMEDMVIFLGFIYVISNPRFL